MKLNKLRYVLLITTLGFFWSCDNEDFTGDSELTPTNPTVTVTSSATGTLSEGSSVTFTAELSEPQIVDVRIYPVIDTEAEYELSDEAIIVPRGKTTGSVTVTFVDDPHVEAAKPVSITLGDDRATNINYTLETVTLDVISHDYSLEWDAALCDSDVDLDMYLGNADFSSYNADGATGACPLEEGSIESLPDDTYDIYVDYYDSSIPTGEGIEINYTASLSRSSGDPIVITGSFDSDDIGDSHVVGQVVIANGTYTVLDADGNTLGTM